MTPEDEDRRAKAWVEAGREATAMILPHPFNRDLFLTANRTKLFTADEVVKFVEKYSSPTSTEQVLGEVIKDIGDFVFLDLKAIETRKVLQDHFKEKLAELRAQRGREP